MEAPKMQNVMRGAWTLSLAALIAKILSAVYRVPFQNMVGDTGFYVYQQVYPLYGIGMTFALSGFPVFISKLVAEAKGPEEKAAVTHRSLVLLIGLSGILFVGLLLSAKQLARWMGDVHLAGLIQSVAFMFLTMPILATGRGYFQGTFDMTKTAVSQVVEQVVRVAVILLAAYGFLKSDFNIYTMGSLAMTGAFFGGACAILTLISAYHRVFKGRHFAFPGWQVYRKLAGRFLREGGSIAMFAAMLIILQLVDSFTVTKGLAASGVSAAAAKSMKGVYDRGQPLVQLGLVVATSLSATLLPTLTTAFATKRLRLFTQTAKQLIHFNVALSAAASVGLIVLIKPINWLLFGDTSGTLSLSVYVISIFLVALINAYNAILQSLDRYRITNWALAIGFSLKVALNFFFVKQFGTAGAALATILALGVIAVLLHWQLPEMIKGSGAKFNLKLVVILILMSAAVSLVVLFLPLTSRLLAAVATLVGALIGVLIFITAATIFNLFTVREVLALPMGSRFLHRTHRKKDHHAIR